MVFVDTNYFIRFLVGDENRHQEIAARLFDDGLTGKIKLFTSIVVFFEIYWVLKSKYKLSKGALAKSLKNILDMSFVKLDEREFLYKSLDIYGQTNLDLEDSYTLILIKSNKGNDLASFDEELLKLFKNAK